MLSETVLDWILDRETCFLLGAGVSKCAGKPLLDDLTAEVAKTMSEETRALLSEIKGTSGREPTVEDLINYLLRLRDLTAARKAVEEADWSVEKADAAIESIQNAIAGAIGKTWNTSPIHASFFSRLLGQKGRSICDVFTLNYDTLIEATLEEQRIRYIDGFWGADNAVFDAATFDERAHAGTTIRLYKLHGSINWYRDDMGVARRCPVASTVNGAKLLIYPTQQKYVQTQYGVYEKLMGRFRDRLRERRPNNKLVVLGYSFADEHINTAIEDGIQESDGNLTVYAFLGAEKDTPAQIERLKAIARRCKSRFNAAVGQEHFIGEGLEASEWESVKRLDLWKFENLVKNISGADHESAAIANS